MITFLKNDADEDLETKAALELLHPKQHPIYMEYLEQKTIESHFAKSVDKISPDLYDMICDKDATIYRIKYFAKIEQDNFIDVVKKAKTPYMQWDIFFKEFHAELMNRLRLKYNP